MKNIKIKFTKTHLILLIIIFNILIINSIYTYQDYQSEKHNPQRDLFGKSIVNNIKNQYSSYPTNSLTQLVKRSINDYDLINNRFVAFNSDQQPYFNSNYILSSFIYQKSNVNINESKVSLESLDYQTLKEITIYISKLASQNEKVTVTFNYDAIDDKENVFVKELKYFAINDNVYVDTSYTEENRITKEISSITTPFGYYGLSDEDGNYYDTSGLDDYNYLEEQLKEVVNDKKFDNDGYYEIINPKATDNIRPTKFTDENNKHYDINIKVCFQELSAEYGINYNQYQDLVSSSRSDETGYIVWCEYFLEDRLYNFTDYFTAHYLNYLISLLLIIGSYFILKLTINKKTTDKIDNNVAISNPPKNKKVDYNKVDLSKQLDDLISNSKNIFIFKKLTCEHYLEPLIVIGNKNELTEVINEAFKFIVRHSSPEDNLTIKIKNNSVYFINNDHPISNNELVELDTIAEIIKAHEYHYQFDSNEQSYQIIFDFNKDK